MDLEATEAARVAGMEAARLERLRHENQSLRWQCEEHEREIERLRSDLRKATQMQHDLGAAHAGLAEERAAVGAHLDAALGKIDALVRELAVERQISAERMALVIEERRRHRSLGAGVDTEEQRHISRAHAAPIGAGAVDAANAAPRNGRPHDATSALPIVEVLDVLCGTSRDSEAQPVSVPFPKLRGASSNPTDISARSVGRGLHASRSNPHLFAGHNARPATDAIDEHAGMASMARMKPPQPKREPRGGRFGTGVSTKADPRADVMNSRKRSGQPGNGAATQASGLPGASATMKLVHEPGWYHPSLDGHTRGDGLAGAGGILVLP